MNAKRIYQLAHLSHAVYRIAYTSMLLYWLFKSRTPQPPESSPRRYH